MTLMVLALLAAGCGGGLVLVIAGFSGRPITANGLRNRGLELGAPRPLARLAIPAGIALVILVTTGWFVAAALAGVAAARLPAMFGAKGRRDDAISRTEATAAWTEMIRDSIVAASGLEEAITATANVAPDAIAPEVRHLVRRLDHERLPDALAAFGTELDHPSGDLVVAALVIASRLEASDLASLLTRLSEATRDEAHMRIRVEVGRTRVRTATKLIVGVVAAAVGFLAIANRGYLSVYDEPAGQVVLGLVGATFAAGAVLLERMAAIDLPARFSARTEPQRR